MNEQEFRPVIATTLEQLRDLSKRHYRRNLQEILDDPEDPLARRQYARLIGVIIKAPFAVEHHRRPSEATKAYIGLRWKEDAELASLAPGTWQYDFMRALKEEQRACPLSDKAALYELKQYKYESNLGQAIFESFRERICGDPKASKAIREATEQAKKAGVKLTDPTVTNLSVGFAATISVAVAGLLSAQVAAVASPVIGGLSLMIMQIGVDGFCRWSKAIIEEVRAIDETEEKA